MKKNEYTIDDALRDMTNDLNLTTEDKSALSKFAANLPQDDFDWKTERELWPEQMNKMIALADQTQLEKLTEAKAAFAQHIADKEAFCKQYPVTAEEAFCQPTKDRQNQINYAVFHETAEANMIGDGGLTAQDALTNMLNRSEITQEEYDWFKNENE